MRDYCEDTEKERQSRTERHQQENPCLLAGSEARMETVIVLIRLPDSGLFLLELEKLVELAAGRTAPGRSSRVIAARRLCRLRRGSHQHGNRRSYPKSLLTGLLEELPSRILICHQVLPLC